MSETEAARDPQTRLQTPSHAKLSAEHARAVAEYRALLEKNAGLQPSPLLNNSTALQFVTAANFLLGRAAHRACVFSDCLSRYTNGQQPDDNPEPCVEKVWAGVTAAAKRFLRRENTRFDILIRGLLDTPSTPEIHELLNEAITDPQREGTITLRIARDKLVPWRDLFQWNFMVVDACDFRYEIDGGLTHALLQFGNPEVGSKFERMFDQMADAIDENADPDKNGERLLSLYWPKGVHVPSRGQCRFGRTRSADWHEYVKQASIPPPEPVPELADADG